MKIKDAWTNYGDFSKIASENMRKLSFAGIAVVWIFSGGGVGEASSIQIEDDLVWVLVLLAVGLAVDFLQYAYLAVAWRVFARRTERTLQGTGDDDYREAEVGSPVHLVTAGEVFWGLKVLLVAVAYVMLIIQLTERVL